MRTPGSGLRQDSPSWPLLLALISYWGTTDNNGNVAGTTIRCTGLAAEPPYDNHALKILDSPAAGQTRDIVTHPAGTDTATVARAFTNVTGAAQQILAGTRFVILSKMPAIAEIHGVFTVLPSAPRTVEPDTDQDLSLSISTVGGIPAAADLTAGTITITRVRAGAETVIANAAACAAANGRIYYDYNFPAANWQAGDEYKAVFTGQQVVVGATTYALSDIRCKGRISREEVGTVTGKLQIAATTIDLDQGIGTYDLFTGTAQAVILESLNIKLPTGAPGGTLTSISIQTDDATPGVIISAADGAVANLTSEADIGWTGTLYITVDTKIQLTIAGGPSVADYICNVTAKCRAVVAGGYLA